MFPVVVHLADQPGLLERISWFSQIGIALAAIIGAIFAGYQLLTVRRVSQATLLLDLDARFDSPELREARNLFSKLREDIGKLAAAKQPLANDQARNDVCKQLWRETLAQMRTEDEVGYLKLISWCGFFETIGMMVKKNYISKTDVLDLFKGPLVDVDQAFRLHIQDRANETGVPNGLFEHALSLSADALAAD